MTTRPTSEYLSQPGMKVIVIYKDEEPIFPNWFVEPYEEPVYDPWLDPSDYINNDIPWIDLEYPF